MTLSRSLSFRCLRFISLAQKLDLETFALLARRLDDLADATDPVPRRYAVKISQVDFESVGHRLKDCEVGANRKLVHS